MRFASRCQPARAAAEQRGGAVVGFAAEAFPPQPDRAAAATTSAIPVQRRVTSRRVQPIYGNPRPAEPVVGLGPEGGPTELGVERGTAWVAVLRREHAVGHRAADERPACTVEVRPG